MRTPIQNAPPPGGTADRFERMILRQDRLCLQLEALADALPDRIDTLAAMDLGESLHPVLRRCQQIEEFWVFPAILSADATLGPMVARLRAEHLEDSDHALLLSEALGQFVRDPRRRDAERLGYVLRCLFQPLRRHSAFDRDVVLPLYRRTLTG